MRAHVRAAIAGLAGALLALGGCRGCGRVSETEADGGVADVADADVADAFADATPSLFDAALPQPAIPKCPDGMVRVAKRFCIDKFEASLVEATSRQPLSPYHVPSHPTAASIHKLWETERTKMGGPEAQAMPLPVLPGYQYKAFAPLAVSRANAIPQGYATGEIAEKACKNAGKRLCTLDEWRTACRGEEGRDYPYGDAYQAGKCNVFREAHPAMVLHDNPSIGHSDPRLNLVRSRGKPLLRRTGATPSCMSMWEGEGIADMVGNVDEWIDDPEGTFVGGFYARSTKDGCQSIIRAHTFKYFDYSTGVRCCSALPEVPP